MTTCPMCAPRVRPSHPKCASRGPNRNGADTKLNTPTGPNADSSRYSRRQPGARPRPSGCDLSSRRPQRCRADDVSANTSRTSPNADKLPQNAVSVSPDPSSRGPQPRRGGPACAGGSDKPNAAASRGSALRADAAHNAPRGLRHPSRAHNSRPRAERDNSPRCNASRSHATVSACKTRRPTRTDLFYTDPLSGVNCD